MPCKKPRNCQKFTAGTIAQAIYMLQTLLAGAFHLPASPSLGLELRVLCVCVRSAGACQIKHLDDSDRNKWSTSGDYDSDTSANSALTTHGTSVPDDTTAVNDLPATFFEIWSSLNWSSSPQVV